MNETNNNSAIWLLIAASVLWGISQVTWRFGDGSALALAGQRSLVGALLLSAVVYRGVRSGAVGKIMRCRAAVLAIVFSGSSMPFTSLMLRELSGPQAALAGTLTPAVILLVAAVIRRRVVWQVAGAVAASAAVATATVVGGGLGATSASGLMAVGVLIVLGVVSMFAMEDARKEGFSSWLLVGLAMCFATVGCNAISLSAGHFADLSTAGLLAATVVGTLATVARVLNTHALPSLGSVATASSAYITALVTAVGGLILFDDDITFAAAVLSIVAAGLSLYAIVKAGKTTASAA